jgi:hypothetical protein
MSISPDEEFIEGPIQNPPGCEVFNVISSKLSQIIPGFKMVASLFGII